MILPIHNELLILGIYRDDDRFADQLKVYVGYNSVSCNEYHVILIIRALVNIIEYVNFVLFPFMRNMKYPGISFFWIIT